MKKLIGIPTAEDLRLAHQAIASYVHRTPVLTSSSIDEILGAELFLKAENLQKVGAFKMRGASCAVASLSPDEKEKGIATHSSGNHAQAVALSAKLHGIKAHIVMPGNAPTIKRKAVEGYGATVYTSGNSIADRHSRIQEVLSETNATFIHPYDNYNIIAGQATAAIELLEAHPDLDVIMAPIGGGGLMSGTALACHYFAPQVEVIGTEPAKVDDAFRAFHSGKVESNEDISTIADGLRTNLASSTLEIIRTHVNQIILVSEDQIVQAMRLVWERMKTIIEPSGAVPIAAILAEPSQFSGKRIGVIVSGGNVDLKKLPF